MPDPVVSNANVGAPASAPTLPFPTSPSAPAADAASLSQMFNQEAGTQPPAPAAAPAAPQQPITPMAGAPPSGTGAPTLHQPSAFARQAADFGIDLPATATDADVFSALTGKLKEVAPLAQYAQALLPHADQINEFFATRATGQPPAAAPPVTEDQWSVEKHFQQQWNAPKLTPEMQYVMNQGLVVRDPDTGVLQAKPGYEVMVAPLLQPLNQAVNWERDAVRDFFQANPLRKTYDALQEPIKRMIQAEVEQRLQASRSQDTAVSGINQFEQANEKWLYQPSASGGRLMTPQGQQFVSLVKQMANNWTGDAATLLTICQRAVANSTGIAPNGTAQAPAAAANTQRQQSFLQNALDQAQYQPSGGAGAVQSPSGPVVVTQRELEDLFLNDFRASSGAAA